MTDKRTIAEARNYAVLNVQSAKEIAFTWLKQSEQVCQDFGVNDLSFKAVFCLQSEWRAG
ncbi:hypothetical protein FBR01_20650 [Anaerolineae bacterium CFX8]|nr:hypothetical protein [Anaerolineae bacterium CFX8]